MSNDLLILWNQFFNFFFLNTASEKQFDNYNRETVNSNIRKVREYNMKTYSKEIFKFDGKKISKTSK